MFIFKLSGIQKHFLNSYNTRFRLKFYHEKNLRIYFLKIIKLISLFISTINHILNNDLIKCIKGFDLLFL